MRFCSVALVLALAACGQQRAAATVALGDAVKCAAYDGLPTGWGSDVHAGMIHVSAGHFVFGSTRGYADEGPETPVEVAGFWIDRSEVTNAQFADFVAATGYITEAEQGSGAAVFRAPAPDAQLTPGSWWQLDRQADWRHPEGASSSIEGRAHEPVVDVTYADAQAYAHWLHRALPSEMQWEYAARAGRSNAAADPLLDESGKPLANFWQGVFPIVDKASDGFAGRAPVGCYADNGWGLYDMVGNVWEWTTDADGAHRVASTLETAALTRGSTAAARRIIKGGSWLCSADYCARARASSRQAQEIDLGATHLGFRTIVAE